MSEETIEELCLAQAEEMGYRGLKSSYQVIVAYDTYDRLKRNNPSDQELLDQFRELENTISKLWGRSEKLAKLSGLLRFISERNPNPELEPKKIYTNEHDSMSRVLTTVPGETYNDLIGRHIGYAIQILEENRPKPFKIVRDINEQALYTGAKMHLEDRLNRSE